MSIVVKFSMGPKKNWFHGTLWNQDTAEELAKNIAMDMGFSCDVTGGYLIFSFCPEGFLWMSFQQGKMVGDCQTNIVGPGFHAAVIHFLELFALKGEFTLRIEDRTGYDKDRDFGKLKREYFHRWFKQLLEDALEKTQSGGEQLLCWPTHYYVPEEECGVVTTHIRRFTRDEIFRMVHSGISMAFAKDFFIWNEEEKDAYYYRNSALVLLNQECYFMPSARSLEDQTLNRRIIQLLEKALQKDRSIPFPKEAYREVCDLDEHPPLELADVCEMHMQAGIGCRRRLLYRTIGNLCFAVPGNFLYDYKTTGSAERYYDGREKDWHDYYICGVKSHQKADFQHRIFEKDNICQTIDFQAGSANGTIAVYKPMEKKNCVVYTVSALLTFEDQTTIVSISTDRAEDQDRAIALIYKIHTTTYNDQLSPIGSIEEKESRE